MSWIQRSPLYLCAFQITGTTMDFHFRIGINARIGPRDSKYFPAVMERYLPVAWGEQESAVTASQASDFKGQVYVGIDVLKGLRWGGIALAITCLLLTAGLLINFRIVWIAADIDSITSTTVKSIEESPSRPTSRDHEYYAPLKNDFASVGTYAAVNGEHGPVQA